MRTSIGCGVVLLSVLGNVTEAAGVSVAVLAGNRGLSPIIINTAMLWASTTAQTRTTLWGQQ